MASRKTKVKATVIVNDIRTEVECELRQRFVPSGKNTPNDQSIKAMQQFMRFTDSVTSGKNVAGGSFFTSNNKDKEENKEKYGNVYENVFKIKEPVYYIKNILEGTDKLDSQHFERISYYLMDLIEVFPYAVYGLLDDPVIKDDQSNFMKNVGHNVGFRDFILKQFIKDLKKGIYNTLIERVKNVSRGTTDPLSYRTF
jgi:hypothetical protein